jgi:hypothetical protein
LKLFEELMKAWNEFVATREKADESFNELRGALGL